MIRHRNGERDDFQERVKAGRGHWMYPFANVKQEPGEGWYIDWRIQPEGIPIEKVEIGDPVADLSLNQTRYWVVRDVDVDNGRIWLDATEANPFLTQVGAGGKKLDDHDWKALTGDAHKESVDYALRWVESGCRVRYDSFTKLLKGVVPVHFGPNGAQGGWYNVCDTHSTVGGKKGLSESEIVEWDARALKRLGLDVPVDALSGKLDPKAWTDFVNGSEDMDERTKLEGEDWNDVETSARFVLEHPMVSIKLRNWSALKHLWTPYYRTILNNLMRPDNWSDPAWVAQYRATADDLEQRWSDGEFVRHEVEPTIRRLASEVAKLRHPICEAAFNSDPYYLVKERAIVLAGNQGWLEVLVAHERDFDPSNRRYVAYKWEELGDIESLLRMEARETHPESLKGILYSLGNLGVDILPLVDESIDRYEAILSRVGEDSVFGYHAKDLGTFIDSRRLNRERGYRRNSDRGIRDIERLVAADPGDTNAGARLIAARIRVGLTTRERVVMAARLGHEAAREAAPEWVGLGSVGLNTYYGRYIAISALGDKREIVSFACDCAERVLSIFEQNVPGDMRPRLAIEAARAWVVSPSKNAADAAFFAFVASSDARDAIDAIAGDAGAAADASAYAALAARDADTTTADAAACVLDRAVRAVRSSQSDDTVVAEKLWQSRRLAKYLLGEITLPPLHVINTVNKP